MGFSGETVQAKGKATLQITITDGEGITIIVFQDFYIINTPIRYKCILEKELTLPIISIPSAQHQTFSS